MPHPLHDFYAALDDTWDAAVDEFADDLPDLMRKLAKANMQAASASHEMDIVANFTDDGPQFLVAVLKRLGKWQFFVQSEIMKRELDAQQQALRSDAE